ncbi:anoctamin-like protein Os01g0706700 [Dioscorea cayenensis subsp. rotundata]|uniref:Anoctamin-like protein Os01g0706700 n=1 Tax=Dioscorea cayennensis subsp. rotundata TaxID=55577 RepID=A0AB40AP33_DIOCR|nr:anoctamin-like protein Os01g0706700 [Dioscorea cayenensis subsp. rotundata]
MNGTGEETGFEVAIVVPKKRDKEKDENCDCVEFLVDELTKAGLIVERVNGISDEFLKLAAPLETLGRAAYELQMKKLTYIGMDLQFEWDQVTAFVRQPDGSLFSWLERYNCFRHLIYGIVNETESELILKFDGDEFALQRNESLVERMEVEGIVKQVFPTHEEVTRKRLLRIWALNWLGFTEQPIDEVYSYFGIKIATYFAFLGMYTKWLVFPAVLGLAVQLLDFGSMQLLVLPSFFIVIISWAVLLFQFWKRKNSALLARWEINYSLTDYRAINMEMASFKQSHEQLQENMDADKPTEKRALQKDEWFGLLLRIRNNAIIVMAIICLQLPFELAYAHLYEIIESDVLKYAVTALYLLAIQYYTKLGGKVSVILIKYENNQGEESSADSLVYKVFGLYFMQTYIGLFYHALLHRNFTTLRQVIIQRLIVSQILENLVENSIPYLQYSYKKYKAIRKKKCDKRSAGAKSPQFASRVEKEYLKPSYTASIGEELEDGLFDDFLELALQFGMIMMFACAFPLIFCFAALNNITEIRTDALKLLVMLKRPVPRASATIGAWLNIFQFLIVMSICTNCILLVCLYDQEGNWRIEPGLAGILIMEHILLLIKFGFSRCVPEEPAWVRLSRVKSAVQARDVCSKQLLKSLSQRKID